MYITLLVHGKRYDFFGWCIILCNYSVHTSCVKVFKITYALFQCRPFI